MSKKGIFDVGGEALDSKSIQDVNTVDKVNVHRNSAHLGSAGMSRRAGCGGRVEDKEKNIPLQSQPWPKTFGPPSAYFLGQESGRRRTKWRPAGSLPQDGDKA